MRTYLYTFLILCATISFLILYKSTSYAHSGPPFVKVNGEYTLTNPIFNTLSSTPKFTVGSDVASPSAYIAGEKMRFEVDEDFFPNPYRYEQDPNTGTVIITDTSLDVIYRWKFGNGDIREGKIVEYTYPKAGTYIFEIQAKYPQKEKEFSTALTIQVNILPKKNYKIPEAKIKMNGKLFETNDTGIVKIQEGSGILFEAITSEKNIKKYIWEFGDGSSAEGKSVYYAYKKDQYFPVFPILRVIDTNNIASDTSLYVDNQAGDGIPKINIPLTQKIKFFFSSFIRSVTSIFNND